jgi:hypothetical protein
LNFRFSTHLTVGFEAHATHISDYVRHTIPTDGAQALINIMNIEIKLNIRSTQLQYAARFLCAICPIQKFKKRTKLVGVILIF